MDRQKRIAMRMSLLALAGIGVALSTAGAKSAIAPSICARLVTQMRGSPATALSSTVLVRSLEGAFTSRAFHS
jgi:hypothetical protein